MTGIEVLTLGWGGGPGGEVIDTFPYWDLYVTHHSKQCLRQPCWDLQIA